MSIREKLLWGLFAGFLALLFLASSTNLIIKEKKREIYPISIIIEDENDEYYVNFKKGADKAAEEFYADVNFITLYSQGSKSQQLELIQREVRDGAKAVIFAPVDSNETIMEMEALKPSCPVILLGAVSSSDFVAESIITDTYEIGRKLGEAAAAGTPEGIPVYLFSEGISYRRNTGIYAGICSVLEREGIPVSLYEKKTEDTYREAIESTVYPGDSRAAIIAMDAQALDEAVKIIEGSTVYQEHLAGLYGAGCTTSILNEVDKGIIDGIVVYNQFDEGYLSVKSAVEAIRGSRQKLQIELESYYLEKDDIRDKKYEKMLYPIE
ncbi:substrate-binding domain-containing protein [Lacrimispora sp. 210928-DFI.3.58]|uniref:substrate-binding domain-containing protein n=1 Tax=Lacrimispora sp. 210928-DFI.3.58 TaxID=2883214 RepID=UPI001D0707AF|nr:substrate-binding domain-containing protein [Lacrimispora sp. 210928-DFI.3.58]MCB7319835.1 substrate-binding domain-containing protein [Lacrimispora sp. 210928-DFI.3.58]